MEKPSGLRFEPQSEIIDFDSKTKVMEHLHLAGPSFPILIPKVKRNSARLLFYLGITAIIFPFALSLTLIC